MGDQVAPAPRLHRVATRKRSSSLTSSEGGSLMALEALTGRIEERELEKEMRSSYLDYAMSVIVGRALPDVRDGLKPVHRRVLYAMHDIGLQPTRPYRKCAFIVGEVMGKYHPHGDSAIYDTLVRMAQEFSLRYHADRRPGQLRLDRRRPGGGDEVHRGAARRGWRPSCCATSTPTRSTSAPTTTNRPRSRWSCRRASRTCWSTAPRGSRSGWRPTSRRTTCARSPPRSPPTSTTRRSTSPA